MTTELATDAQVSDAQAAVTHADGQASPGTEQAQSVAQPETAFANEDAELAALEARIAKGETGEELPGGQQGASGDQGVLTGDGAAAGANQQAGDGKPAAPAQGEQKPKVPMDPKDAAIIALRKKTQEQERQLAMREGELNALRPLVRQGELVDGQPSNSESQQQQPTYEDQYAEIDTRKQELAVAVDSGTMSMADFVKESNALDAQKFNLQKQEIQEQNAPPTDMALQQHTDKLLTEYPVLSKLTAQDIAPYEALARARANAGGKPIGSGPVETARLRTMMAFLVERDYDPARHQQRVQNMKAQNSGVKPGAAAGTTGQQPGGTGSRPTAVQREAKLALAASHPVNIGETGAGGITGEPTEAEATAALMNKSEDEAIRWLDQHPGIAKKLGYA